MVPASRPDRHYDYCSYCSYCSYGNRRSLPISHCSLLNPISFAGLEFLPLSINGRRSYGLLDNQASWNFMSKDFVRENGIDIDVGHDIITAGDARIIRTIGRTRIQCAALLNRRQLVNCEFVILDSTVHPIILGRPFFHSSNLFSNLGPRSQAPYPRKKRLEQPFGTSKYEHHDFKLRVRVPCILIETETLATIDKAASIDLMSLSLIRRLCLSMFLRRKHRATIVLGDGRKIQSEGTVQTTVIFAACTGRKKKLTIEFHIVETLAFGMILGSSTVQTLKHWTTNNISFEWIPVIESRMLLCAFQLPKGTS